MSRLQVVFRSVSTSHAIQEHINKYYIRLTRIYHKVDHCKVVVDVNRNNKHKAKMFNITISLHLTGKEILCRKKHPNLYIAMRDGFDTIEKLLKKNYKKELSHRYIKIPDKDVAAYLN